MGTPVAMLLQKCDATVTVVHSQTPMDAMIRAVKEADIVVAAAGRTEMVKGHWLKRGATVIDVGINAVEVRGNVDARGSDFFCFTRAHVSTFVSLVSYIGLCAPSLGCRTLRRSAGTGSWVTCATMRRSTSWTKSLRCPAELVQ